MATFKDINFIRFPTGSSELLGCQEVTTACTGDEIEFSECVDESIQYRGLTGLHCTGEASQSGGGALMRDVTGVTFGGTPIPEALSVELSEVASELSTSSNGDLWITIVGVTQRSVEVTVTSRAIDVIMDTSGPVVLGTKGDLIANAKLGSLASGLTDASVSAFTAASLIVTEVTSTGRHTDFGEAAFTAKGTAFAKDFTGGALTSIHVGQSGEFSWQVPNALAAGSPATATITIGTGGGGAVVMEKSATLTHQEMVEESITVKAFSADGITPPITVS